MTVEDKAERAAGETHIPRTSSAHKSAPPLIWTCLVYGFNFLALYFFLTLFAVSFGYKLVQGPGCVPIKKQSSYHEYTLEERKWNDLCLKKMDEYQEDIQQVSFYGASFGLIGGVLGAIPLTYIFLRAFRRSPQKSPLNEKSKST